MSIADYIKTEISKLPNWINYILLKCNLFGSLVYGKSYLVFSKSIPNISPEQKLLDMVNYSIKNVPYYREKYGSLTIHNIQEFEEKIGFIDKNEVMMHWDKFIADGTDPSKCMIGTTGGTSGKPLKLLVPRNRYIVEHSFIHRMLKQFEWSFDTFAVLRNHKLPENRKYMINPVMRQVVFDAFRLSPEYLRVIYKIMRKYNIHFIHAYPSTLFQFGKYCYNQNLDLSFIKLCRLTSEQITEEQMNFFVNTLHLTLSYSYGHSEKLILAGNTPNTYNYTVEQAYGYLELISEENSVIKKANMQGQMTGTTYYNYDFPLIRYKTGDYSSYSNNIDPQEPFKKELNQILGRWQSTLIYCADGKKVSTASLNLHDNLYEKIDGMQYIQEKAGELKILIIRGKGYNMDVEKEIYDHMKLCLGKETVIKLQYVDRLIHQPNGKFLLLISSI